jgi:hypothetical protein
MDWDIKCVTKNELAKLGKWFFLLQVVELMSLVLSWSI